MPYGKRKSNYARKTKYTPKSRGRRASSSTRKSAKRAKTGSSWDDAVSQGLKHISSSALAVLKSKLGINAETKYVPTATTGFQVTVMDSLTQTQFNNLCTPVALGNTAQQRSGDSVRMTRWLLHGYLTAAAGAAAPVLVRVIFVNCGKVPASTVTAGNILQVATDINSPLADDPVNSVKVVSDITYTVYPAQTGYQGAGPSVLPVEHNMTPLNHHIRWTPSDTTGVQANCLEGNIQCWMMSAGMLVATSAANSPTLQLFTQMDYVDN